MNRTPIVAIVGRPNVGKSTLFNRMIQKRHAIVDEQEGVTRDRIYEMVEWGGKNFLIVDTGGYIPDKADVIDSAIRKQVEYALNEASVVLLVVDGREGVIASDLILAELVRKSEKPAILLVNKIDSNEMELLTGEFYSLGLETVHSVSALVGRKIGDMLDVIIQKVGVAPEVGEDDNVVRISIVGCPNVGKSSITNRLLGKQKSIVTHIPGTTRDAIDSTMRYNGRNFILVDTAGLRKKSKVKEDLEFYSNVRTQRALEKSDVVVVVVDAKEGFRNQDQRIIEQVITKGKSLVMVVNKWDLIQKSTHTLNETKKEIRHRYASLRDYPILFVSAKTNQRVSTLLRECEGVFEAWSRKFPTSQVNTILNNATNQLLPPAVRGKHIRLKYATQTGFQPPKISVFCNFPHLIPASYRNYLENQFRKGFDLSGTPLKLQFKRA